ncbi:hypothetical protein ALC57_16251 [Trachymyrmex cornetzi]|uniref:Uncharacterized protein n=1 Tax=Trachymyrmex cornetzi TaxID=471704 RepID=A0A195DFP4_9HYME|nr:hypothetical protein ALC57_16251 [Trachymyrmex cornetzi]
MQKSVSANYARAREEEGRGRELRNYRGEQRVRREDFWCNAPVNSRESIVQQLAVETAMPTARFVLAFCRKEHRYTENATALHKSRNKQTSRSKRVPAKIFTLSRERC